MEEDYKKYFIISTIMFVVIAMVIMQVVKYKENKINDNYIVNTNKIDNQYINVNDFGIYLQNKSGTYDKKEGNDYPTKGYVLNEDRTKCYDYHGSEVKGQVHQTDEGNIRLETTTSIYCQMYFDIDEKAPVITSMNVNGLDKESKERTDYIYEYSINYSFEWLDTDVVYYCIKEGTEACNENEWQKTSGKMSINGKMDVSKSDGPKVISAYLKDKAKNESKVVANVSNKTITLDRTAPTVTLTLKGSADTGQTLINEETYTQTKNITYTANITEENMDGYCIGEGECETYISSTDKAFNNEGISLNDTEGIKTIKIKVKDKAGNIGSTSKTITLNKTNPTTPSIIEIYDIWGSRSNTYQGYSSNAGENGTWTTNNGDPQIIFSDIGNISGVNGFYVELSTALTTDIPVQVFYATSSGGYSEGNSVRGTLKAGEKKIYLPMNTSGTWKQVRFDIGSSSGLKYTIKHLGVSGTIGQWNRDAIILKAASTESNNKIVKWEWTYDTSTWTSCSEDEMKTFATTSYSGERNGKAYMRACNESGRCSGYSTTLIKIDNTNPTASVSSVSASTTSITVTVGGSDSGSGIAARYCKATKTGYDSNWKTATGTSCVISGLTEGTSYTIKVKTKDNSGRESSEVQYSKTVTTETSSAGKYVIAKKPAGLNTAKKLGGLYRFVGACDAASNGCNNIVNNFVCFGTDSPSSDCAGKVDSEYMYRIIGIDPDTGEMKLIKNTAIREESTYKYIWNGASGGSWCGEELCEWPNSDLYKRLNGLSDGENQGYSGDTNLFIDSSTSNVNYIKPGNKWYNMIKDTEWMYGDSNDISTTADEVYTKEKSWTKKVTAKIGLMNVSDYYYSYARSGNDSSSTNCYAPQCGAGWLYISRNGKNGEFSSEWTIASYGLDSRSLRCAWFVFSYGDMSFASLSTENSVRPVFYLTSSAKITSGSGTVASPFIIS